MTTATKITMVRVFLLPVFMVLMYLSGGEEGLWMWLSLAVFIIASLTDFVDGYIARHYNQTTDLGKFLDPLADKLLTIAAMVMFCRWAGWSGKVKTASTMVGLCAMMALPGIDILNGVVIGLIVVTTLYSGIEYFIQNGKCLLD